MRSANIIMHWWLFHFHYYIRLRWEGRCHFISPWHRVIITLRLLPTLLHIIATLLHTMMIWHYFRRSHYYFIYAYAIYYFYFSMTLMHCHTISITLMIIYFIIHATFLHAIIFADAECCDNFIMFSFRWLLCHYYFHYFFLHDFSRHYYIICH